MDPDVASDAARETIRKNYSKLGSKISVEDILPKLFSQRIIGDFERQEIQAGKTQLQRSQTLVDCLLQKSGKQFEQFCLILEGTRVFADFARSLRSQYEEEIAVLQRRRGRGVGKQPVEEQASLPHKTAVSSSGEEAVLSEYDSLTVDQCDSIVNRLQSSLQIVDMPVLAQALNDDRILTPDEFARLQSRSLPNRHRWLLAALRRTRMIGLKSFHRALESTSRTAPQHREVLSKLVDRVEEVAGMKITLTESSPQSDVPLMKLLQPPETASPSGSGGKPQEIGQISLHLESSKESVQAPQPPPSGQEHLQAHHPPSIHHSTPAPVSPLSSIGLGAGASGRDRHQKEGLGMSEGRLPQSQLAAPPHGRPTTGQQAKESGDVPEEGKQQPTSLPGRQSLSPRLKRSRLGNGSKLEVINTTLLKACMDGNEDNIESIVNMSRSELNVACVGESGLSPLHYAVKKKLKKGLAAMVQHATFTLSVTDKDGQTPLHYAAKDGDKELLQLLNRSSYEAFSGGDSGSGDLAPENIQDKDGNTALHLCLEGGHFDIVKSLVVVFNCSLLVKNNKGLRPVHLAADKGNNDIVKYLMRHEHPPDEDTHSHYSTASESEPGEASVKIRKEWSSSELEVTSGSGDKSLVSTEQEGGHSWGSSEMLVGSGVTPTTSALYGFLQLRGDKMNKTRMEVRSAAVLTGPQERSLMELKEQVRVLRERLETAQKKMSHLETEIQQHHIREALRQAHLHPSEDEEADRRKYSSYRHEDLVEELLYVKSFVQKFEVVAIESKATAQRFSAELEAEKASNQALRDSSDVSRSLWEKRIRDLSTTIKRREDKIAELETKIEALKKKKGKEKEKEEERDELAGPLQRILREGAGIIMYRHSQTLQQHQQERKAHEEMMAQARRQLQPQALTWKETPSPSTSLQQERPSPLGTGQDSEPAGAVAMTTQAGSLRVISAASKLSLGSVQSANQFLQLLLRSATAQVHTASVVLVESTAKTVTTAILQSAIEGRVKSVILTPPLECVSMTIAASSTEPSHLVGLFPPSFTNDLRILGLLQNAACGLLAEVLPSLVDPASLPSTLQGTAARESLQRAATASLIEVQNAIQPFQQVNVAQVGAKVVTKALNRLHSSSTKQLVMPAGATPIIQTLLTVPSLPDESSYTAVSRLLPLLMPPTTMCMVRVFDRNDIVAKMSALAAFYDPAVKEVLEHIVTTDVPDMEGARIILGEIQKDEMPSVAIRRQIDALRQYVSTTEHPRAISNEDFTLPETLISPTSKELLQNGIKVLQSLSTDSLPVQSVPVRWLLLLDVLTEAALQCVDLSTVERIASSLCRMLSTEVRLALVRLTELGHVMYFPQAEKLSSTVIIDRSAVGTALVRLSQLKTEAPAKHLPCTANGVVEECLLHSSFEGLSVPAETLTEILEHLCIIGETALTTTSLPLLHAQCRVFIVPALLPAVSLMAPMRAEEPALHHPSSPFLTDPLAASSISLQLQREAILILSRSRVLLTTFIPALCRSLSKSPIFASSGVFFIHDVAFNQIVINPHEDVQLNVQVFEPHSDILGAYSGIKVGVGLPDQHLESVLRHLMHAVSLVEEAYGPVGAEWAMPCLQGREPPHPLKLSADYLVSSGRVLTHCAVCSAEVTLSSLQRLMVDSYTKISSEKPVGGSVLLSDSAPSSAMSLSEVMKVVESLGDGVGWDQVRQVAHRLGFTQTEVTSLEQVVGGEGKASTLLLHLLLVWQKQKHRVREGGREELAAALYEGGMLDAASKVDKRMLESEHQFSPVQFLSPTLEDSEVDLISSHVGKRWEQLAASLGFRDTDDPEFSDCTGEEACKMMLAQWRREQGGRNIRLTLSVALKDMGLDSLSERIQTAAEAHSRPAAPRAD